MCASELLPTEDQVNEEKYRVCRGWTWYRSGISTGSCALHEHGIDADVIMGSRTKDLLFYIDEMKAVAGNVSVTTDDGTYGFHGNGCQQLEDDW